MKKFSILSFLMFMFGLCACISTSYLISGLLLSTVYSQNQSTVSVENKNVYAISFGNSSEKNELVSAQENLYLQNGAGFLYKDQEEKYYLLSSIYQNMNDAELVKANLKTNGIEVQILPINLPNSSMTGNFSQNEKTILESALKSNFDTFKSLFDVVISFDTNIIDKTKAKIECNTVFSNFVSAKTNFETIFVEQLSEKEFKLIDEELKRIYNLLSNLISEKYESVSQTFSSLIKMTYCQILLE